MRIVFLGSPEPALYPLKWLVSNPDLEVVGIVSQPARPAGRGRVLTDPPVAAWAKSAGFPVLQPASARDAEFLDMFRLWAPDVAITAAYGQILNQAFLDVPKRATINIHPSLLPKYRGATPVASALYAGDKVTGVTILFTVRQLDAGAIIVQKQIPIEPNETGHHLLSRLFAIGSELLGPALEKLRHPEFDGTPQELHLVTHCHKFSKEDGLVDWDKSSEVIYNRYRAFDPWPGTYSSFKGKRIQLLFSGAHKDPAPGQVGQAQLYTLDNGDKILRAVCGHGSIDISHIKIEGKSQVNALSFTLGAGRGPWQFGDPK